MDANVGTALLFTSAAGLSTTIGSLLGIALKKPSPRFTSFTLGFAAGVMIYVSFVELLPRAIESSSFLIGNAAFLGGIALMFLIDAAVPHEYMAEHYGGENKGLLRTGLLMAVGLGIHNFPEGMATFAATLKDVKLGDIIEVRHGRSVKQVEYRGFHPNRPKYKLDYRLPTGGEYKTMAEAFIRKVKDGEKAAA